MMGLSLLNRVNDRLTMIKWLDSAERNFGNVIILCVGDLYQLPPVGQVPMFRYSKTINSAADLAPLLWHNFKLHELKQVMHQKNVTFANMLKSL